MRKPNYLLLALGVLLISLPACSSSSVPAAAPEDVASEDVAAVEVALPEEQADEMDIEAVTFRVLGMLKAASGAT